MNTFPADSADIQHTTLAIFHTLSEGMSQPAACQNMSAMVNDVTSITFIQKQL